MSGLLSLILTVLQPFGWIHKMMVTEKKNKEEEEEAKVIRRLFYVSYVSGSHRFNFVESLVNV